MPSSNVGFIRAMEAANVPIVNELNSGNNTGVKQGTGCLDSRYRRSSSYDSFYQQAARRPNLTVLHYAPVQSVITETVNGTPTATGVVFVDEQSGLVHNVTAKREVILSLGAFQTPQLLMVSVSPWQGSTDPRAHRRSGNRPLGRAGGIRHLTGARQRECRAAVRVGDLGDHVRPNVRPA